METNKIEKTGWPDIDKLIEETHELYKRCEETERMAREVMKANEELLRGKSKKI